jgi:hypothetical protein
MPIPGAQTDRLIMNGDGASFAYSMYSKWIEECGEDNPAGNSFGLSRCAPSAALETQWARQVIAIGEWSTNFETLV